MKQLKIFYEARDESEVAQRQHQRVGQLRLEGGREAGVGTDKPTVAYEGEDA